MCSLKGYEKLENVKKRSDIDGQHSILYIEQYTFFFGKIFLKY